MDGDWRRGSCLLSEGAGSHSTVTSKHSSLLHTHNIHTPPLPAPQRAHYDSTGDIMRSAEEEFMDSFAGGSFRDRVRSAEAAAAAAPSIQEQITVRQSKESGSHSAGFEAWMRGRGTGGVQVFTADDVIDQFGVVKGSYDAVPLPRIRAHVVRCSGPGRAAEVLSLGAEDLPAELEWGQVLVSVRYAPINPADLYTVATGGTYGQESVKPPFVPGHDAVGVVVKVREGGGDAVVVVVYRHVYCWFIIE